MLMLRSCCAHAVMLMLWLQQPMQLYAGIACPAVFLHRTLVSQGGGQVASPERVEVPPLPAQHLLTLAAQDFGTEGAGKKKPWSLGASKS